VPIGIYRLNGRETTRALAETELMNKTSIIEVVEPLRSTFIVPPYCYALGWA